MGISPSQLKMLRDRLDASKSGKSDSEPQSQNTITLHDGCVILGIDPSLRGTGYGLIKVSQRTYTPLDYGVISCSKSWPHSQCLGEIQTRIHSLIDSFHPQYCILEGLFYTQNLKTAIVMGEARGASMAVAGAHSIDCFEIAPRKVKQALVGFGGAQKSAVAKMVQRILKLQEEPQADAADALAIALAFTFENQGVVIEPPRPL